MALTAGALALLAPAAAQAKTKTVTMGLPSRDTAKTFQKAGADVNDFFPHGVTIRVGDSVRFVPTGFHSVDIPKRGGGAAPLISPTGQKESGVLDAAGQPFWFNGADRLGFTPSLAKLNFGKRLTYTGAKSVASGLPLAEKLKPMTVRFTKAGRYTYYCNIHAGMKGTVRVRRAGASIPSAKQDARVVRRMVARDLKVAKRLRRTRPPANTISVGAAGPHGVESFAMYPGTANVSVGQAVTLRMAPASFEVHTATFGPGDPEDPKTYLGEIEAGFNAPVFDGRAVYASEPPGSAAATLTPTLHGNGFWNTGVLDSSSATPLPASNSVRFGAPGTYTFYCLVHPFMRGTVVVR